VSRVNNGGDMEENSKIVQFTTSQGAPIQVGDRVITPQSQALKIRFSRWGFVWNRPVAVLIEQEGNVQRVPVVDITRWILWGISGGVLMFWIYLLINKNRKQES
jgi:hypothetical protein